MPCGFAKPLLTRFSRWLAEFHRIAGGILMLGTRPPRSVDEAVAIGERLSSVLLAQFLEASGIPALAVNAADIIVTDAVFGNASPQMEQTGLKCQERAGAAA